MATIARNFDPVNYVTKTKNISLSAGSSYTLGDAYNGGTAVDLFVSADFSVAVGGTAKTKDIDFTLTGIDSDYTEDYGTTFFTVIKSLTITATVTITYRCHGTYTDAGIINAHETRLDGHDTDIDSLTDTLASHSERMTNIESVNTSQTEDITEAQTDIIGLRSNLDTHVANTTDAHGATSAATANKMMIRDANARVQIAAGAADLDAVNKQQMDAALNSLSLSAGTGNVTSAETSASDGEIVVMSGTSGKAVKKSGILASAISTLQGYFTGGAANSSLRVDSHVLPTGSDLVVEIYNRLSVGNTIILYGFNLVYAPVASKTIRYDVFFAGSTRWDVKAYDADSFLSYECAIVNGVPPTWTQLTDASGNAINAINAVNANHQKDLIRITGTYTYNQIAASFRSTFGSGVWSAGVQGSMYTDAISSICGASSDGTSVFIYMLSPSGSVVTLTLMGSASVNCSMSF